MRVTITERRAVLRTLHEHGVRSSLSGMELDRIANRTPGSRGTMGIARVRACLNEEMRDEPQRVRRRRSWGTEYVYWITEEGIEWLKG